MCNVFDLSPNSENYGDHKDEPVQMVKKTSNVEEDKMKINFFRQNSDIVIFIFAN